jgi:hypothetical protein
VTGNEWLTDLRDLTTLRMSNATLERCLELTDPVARAHFGPDAQVSLDRIGLMYWLSGRPIWNSPHLRFRCSSLAGEKSGGISFFAGSLEPKIDLITRGPSHAMDISPPPWRTDPSWPDLVGQSWTLERPFEGNVSLVPRPEGHGTSRWYIEYKRLDQDVIAGSESFSFEQGQLQRLGPDLHATTMPRPDLQTSSHPRPD